MATWEDGPEYAPLERPADFAMPPGALLDVVPPVQVTPTALAPKSRPVFADPSVPVAPLATLVPDVQDPRDPQRPFEVASSSLTSDSAWGALQPSLLAPPPDASPAGGTPEPFAAPTPAAGPWGPAPGGPSWPPPEQPLVPQVPEGTASGYPAPGTPDWFGPSPSESAPPRTAVTFRKVLDAATPGLCICLVIGGLIVMLSPIMLGLAFGLTSRVIVAKESVRRAFTIAVSLVGLIAVVAALSNQTGFTDWWNLVGKWSLFFCWALLVATLGLIYRAHTQPDSPAPRRSNWG